jgi:hypothetical protein
VKFDLREERRKDEEMALDGLDLKGEGNKRKRRGCKTEGWRPFHRDFLPVYPDLQSTPNFSKLLYFIDQLINQTLPFLSITASI